MARDRAKYEPIARAAALRHGYDQEVYLRQIDTESGFDPDAVSPAGAIGIAQLVPRWHPTADPRDPVASLEYAARWMGSLVRQYGSYRLALAAYNAGPGRVDQYGGVPPFPETHSYLTRILGDGWPEPGGIPMPEPPIAFEPDYPPIIQPGQWQCSIGTASWMLHAIGRTPSWAWIQGAMAPRWVNSDVGLRDATGRGIVEFFDEHYPEYQDLTNFDASATWDEIAALAGTRPLGLGLRSWAGPGLGHWSGVRGIMDGVLHLANPAGTGPRYGQTYIDRGFVESRGPASMVWIKTPSVVVPPAPPSPADELADLRALVAELNTILGVLSVDVAHAIRQDVEGAREKLTAALAAVETLERRGQ